MPSPSGQPNLLEVPCQGDSLSFQIDIGVVSNNPRFDGNTQVMVSAGRVLRVRVHQVVEGEE